MVGSAHPTKTLKAVHHRGTEDTEVFLLNAPAARLTILKAFPLCPLCLCGEQAFDFVFNVRSWPIAVFCRRQVLKKSDIVCQIRCEFIQINFVVTWLKMNPPIFF